MVFVVCGKIVFAGVKMAYFFRGSSSTKKAYDKASSKKPMSATKPKKNVNLVDEIGWVL